MTREEAISREEAIEVLKGGDWWEIVAYLLPHTSGAVMTLRSAINVAIADMRAQAELERRIGGNDGAADL